MPARHSPAHMALTTGRRSPAHCDNAAGAGPWCHYSASHVVLACDVPPPFPGRGVPAIKGGFMTRIPSHSIEDAPAAARSLLAEMVQFSPTGRLLNLHAQMAHAPAVLEAYV